MKELNENNSAFLAQVRGRVQGVGFRYSTTREAEHLGLYGWVRNTANGDVEVWAEGPLEKLNLFEIWLNKGPPRSRIDFVKKDEVSPKGYTKFMIVR